MKQKFLVFALILSSIFTTSCIEVIEELWVHKDKSGEASFRIDIGSLGLLISAASDYIDKNMLNEIINAPKDKSKDIINIEGVSEVKPISLIKSGKLGLKFKFENQKALNNSYYALLGVDKKWFYPTIFKIKKHKFKKLNLARYLQDYLMENKDNFKSEDLLKMITFKSIYHFPKEVKSMKNKNHTKLIPNNSVIQSYEMNTILNEEVDLGNLIRF